MYNSTPPTPPSGEQARAQAEAALKEKGWVPREWDSLAGALDGSAPDGSYSIRMYAADGPDAPREALCQIDARTHRDHSGDVSPYLWMVGIPRPEEVPELFRGYPGINGWSDDGSLGNEVLDLLTGDVIPERRAQELLKDPVLEMIREAKKSITERAGVFRDLVSAGWDPRSAEVAFGSNTSLRSITTRMACPPEREMLLVLTVYLGETGGVGECWVQEQVEGVEVPIDHWKERANPIPTPDEAAEAYRERLRRGRVVRGEHWVYEERW